MLLRAIIFSSMLLVTSAGVSTTPEDPQKSGESLLEQARQISEIRSPNASPFHLKATFSFIGEDLETVQGTYTEVWTSNSQWRRDTEVGNLPRIEIGGASKRWISDSGKNFPEQAGRIPTLLEPVPTRFAKFQFESIADRSDQDEQTRCAITRAGLRKERYAFCFDKNRGVLVESVEPHFVGEHVTDYSCQYGDFRRFGEYWFPREMACFVGGHRKLETKVAEVAQEPSADAAIFTPPAGAVEMGNCLVDPVSPRPTSTPDPVFPFGRPDRSSSVEIWLVVDTKGKPRDLRVVQSGGKPFDDEALGAVRAWRFKAGTCNGEPMPMPINVEVEFRRY